MKKAIRKISIITIVAIMLFGLTLFTACGDPIPPTELLRQRGFTIEVTFNANGGSFANAPYEWSVFLRPGQRVPNPTVRRGGSRGEGEIRPAVRLGFLNNPTWHRAMGYEFYGYDEYYNRIYRPYRDPENPNQIWLEEEPWNFNTPIGEEHVPLDYEFTLYANWTPASIFRFVFVTTLPGQAPGFTIPQPAPPITPLPPSEEDDDDEDEEIVIEEEDVEIGQFLDLRVMPGTGRLRDLHNNLNSLRSILPGERMLSPIQNRMHSLRGVYLTYEDAQQGNALNASEIARDPEHPRATDEYLYNLIHRAYDPNYEGNQVSTPVVPTEESDNSTELEEPTGPNLDFRIHYLFTTWVEGTMNFVSNPSDMPLSGNVYLESDLDFYGWRRVTNIDGTPPFEGWNRTQNFTSTIFGNTYNGTFRGNGFTVSNIHLDYGFVAGETSFGLFRNLSGTIRDVTFNNITIEVFPDVPSNAHVPNRPNENMLSNFPPRHVGFLVGQVIFDQAIIHNVSFIGENSLIVNSSNYPHATYGHINFARGTIDNNYMFGVVPGSWAMRLINDDNDMLGVMSQSIGMPSGRRRLGYNILSSIRGDLGNYQELRMISISGLDTISITMPHWWYD